MILCAAQFHPKDGNIEKNINIHMELINKAHEECVDCIQFPEMSLTGYQQKNAESLAFIPGDKRLDPFKNISVQSGMVISLGAPISIGGKLYVGNFIITPKGEEIYLKHYLHPGEKIYFSESTSYNPQIELKKQKLGFAICFDIENRIHWQQASNRKTNIYSIGIFYSPASIKKLHNMAAKQSLEFNMNVIISNYSIGTFGAEAGGSSGIWNCNGENIAILDPSSNGLAIAENNKDKWSGKILYI